MDYLLHPLRRKILFRIQISIEEARKSKIGNDYRDIGRLWLIMSPFVQKCRQNQYKEINCLAILFFSQKLLLWYVIVVVIIIIIIIVIIITIINNYKSQFHSSHVKKAINSLYWMAFLSFNLQGYAQKMGKTRPWPEALKKLTESETLNVGALSEYF